MTTNFTSRVISSAFVAVLLSGTPGLTTAQSARGIIERPDSPTPSRDQSTNTQQRSKTNASSSSSNADLQRSTQQMYQSMKDNEKTQYQLQRNAAEGQASLLTQEQQNQVLDENRRLTEERRQWEQQQKQQQQQQNAQAAAAEKKVTDATKGCSFLDHANSGNTHPPGSRFCHDGKLKICQLTGKNSQGDRTYSWFESPGTYGCESQAVSPSVEEGNLMSLRKIKVYEED